MKVARIKLKDWKCLEKHFLFLDFYGRIIKNNKNEWKKKCKDWKNYI